MTQQGSMRAAVRAAAVSMGIAVLSSSAAYAVGHELRPDVMAADDAASAHRAPQLRGGAESAASARGGLTGRAGEAAGAAVTGGAGAGNALHMRLRRVKILGMPEIRESDLQAQIGDLLGREIDANLLRRVQTQLSDYCRKVGYSNAEAFFPEQSVSDGALAVYIAAGTLGEVRICNKTETDGSYLAYLTGSFADLKGEKIKEKEFENRLLRLSDLGLFDIHGRFEASEDDPLKSDLVLEVKNAADRVSFTAFADNNGNRSSGRNRYGAQMTVRNVTTHADTLSMFYAGTGGEQSDWFLSYEIPVNSMPAVAGFEFSHETYELKDEYRVLGAEGGSYSAEGYVRFPLFRDMSNKTDFRAGVRYRKMRDEFSVFDLEFKKHSIAGYAEISSLNALTDQTFMSSTVRLTAGKLYMDDEFMMMPEDAYFIANADVRLRHDFTQSLSLRGLLSMQAASRALDGSEVFTAGGFGRISALESSDLAGDSGVLVRADLMYAPFPDTADFMFRAGPHIEAASVYEKGGSETSASSMGLGAELQVAGLYLTADYSFSNDAPYYAREDHRLSVSVSYGF